MSTSGSHYKAVPIAANSTYQIKGSRIKGFVPTATGTWTFTLVIDGVTTALPGITVAAGGVGRETELPIFVGTDGLSSVTTSAGGAGILMVS
jgi:hypothetical protein